MTDTPVDVAAKLEKIAGFAEYSFLEIDTSPLRAAASLLRDMSEREKWLPIETAPKDGAHFLAYDPCGDMYRAAYHSDGYIVSFCGQYVTVPPEPLCWRPLPAPPEAK